MRTSGFLARTLPAVMLALAGMTTLLGACSESTDNDNADPSADIVQTELVCVLSEGAVPEFSEVLGCPDDFLLLSSEPFDASIPGARSTKTVVDRVEI